MHRTILCYGDSNTWGYVPSNYINPIIHRYSRAIRWTGLLQSLLGTQYYVVEEGLNGRTTNLDHFIAPDRNGKTYLPSCLYTHAPIDLVVLSLGGNDLKSYYNRSPEQVRDGLAELISIIRSSMYGKDMMTGPKLLILSPPMIQEVAETFKDENGIAFFEGVTEKANKLVALYKELAKQQNCYFLDVSRTVSTSPVDGLHFDAEGHLILSQLLYKKITDIYKFDDIK